MANIGYMPDCDKCEKCSYPKCNHANNPLDNTYSRGYSCGKLYDCIWCGKKYHKKCLLQLGILVSDNSNIECSFCFPKLPLNITCFTPKPYDKLEILNIGDTVYPELELEKTSSDRPFIYPIGYTCDRILPSYKNDFLTTKVRFEIFCVDEHYPECGGKKDTYLFQITYRDDEHNPIKVLKSPRYITAAIKNRYKSITNIPSGKTLYGLDNKYIQYLILTHIPQASDVSINNPEQLLLEINDSLDGIFQDKKIQYKIDAKSSGKIQFDPQQELFNF